MEKLVKYSKVVGNGKITIPKEMRDRLDIKDGDMLYVGMIGSIVTLKKIQLKGE